jgi:hypothetical protein
MLRIPGSHNYKCVQRNNGLAYSTTQVKVIKKWNGKRVPICLLIGSFHAYLVNRKLDQMHKLQNQFSKYSDSYGNRSTKLITWIERLLQNPLPDHRKYCLWRILSPYLLNVKKLSKEESYSIMNDWLDKCNKLERLNFNAKAKIKEGLKSASKGYYPISLEKLNQENKALYDTLVKRRSVIVLNYKDRDQKSAKII